MPRRKKVKKVPPSHAHLIDTNVVLRYLIGDDPANAARAADLMGRVERAETVIIIPDVVVAETVWTLESYHTSAGTGSSLARPATARRMRIKASDRSA